MESGFWGRVLTAACLLTVGAGFLAGAAALTPGFFSAAVAGFFWGAGALAGRFSFAGDAKSLVTGFLPATGVAFFWMAAALTSGFFFAAATGFEGFTAGFAFPFSGTDFGFVVFAAMAQRWECG